MIKTYDHTVAYYFKTSIFLNAVLNKASRVNTLQPTGLQT